MLIKYNVSSTPALRVDNKPLYKVYTSNSIVGNGTQNSPLAVLGRINAKGLTDDGSDYAISIANLSAINLFSTLNNGKILFYTTLTPSGTNGAQTIHKPTGVVNIAAGGSSIVVTNNLVTANSTVFAVIRTADSTAAIKNVVPTDGSFTINLTAAATAAISIGFFTIN